LKIPTYARYDYCCQKACRFLEEYNIREYPINAEKIVFDSGWELTSYFEIMTRFKCDREKVIRCLGSADGFTQYDGYDYSIAYNDDDTLGNRIRFTLMHEIGHIYLNHLVDFEATKIFRGSLTAAENKVLENEANAFARNVLAPAYMIKQLKKPTPGEIVRVFGLTPLAAKTRLSFYSTDSNLNDTLHLQDRLKKIFINFYYKHKCTHCKASIILFEGGYCPMCGNKTLKWGEGTMVYKENIFLDNNSKAIRCPKCDNEHILAEGEYCHICGTYLVNKCDNRDAQGNFDDPCGHLLSANARFCTMCGSKSTFFNEGILKPWNESDGNLGFLKIPDGIPGAEEVDEDLPFS